MRELVEGERRRDCGRDGPWLRRHRIWVIEEEKNGERIVKIGAQNPYRNTGLSVLLLFSE
jgi:hypothetical protein